jgi:protoporphyrin/coproporphyrin ferrochelatase
MAFDKEPAYTHGTEPRVGVLYCNLGTPDEPTPAALRRYLGEFLSDSRVVEISKPIWWLILHGIILRVRPAKSAKKYASIWMQGDGVNPGGSPLRVWTEKQSKLLLGHLGERGHQVHVAYAMRYGNPSIASQLDALKEKGCTRILILPAYPQYSATTTASVFDAVYAWAAKTRRIPEFRFVNNYHDDTGYIDALALKMQAHFQREGTPEKLVLSFHGVPERTLRLGDPYHCECYKTARLLRERLNLKPEQVMVTFQSRFGRAKWLEPYTEPTLIELAKKGVHHVAVACPGFSVDCLETLEEINQEAREAFLHAGGKRFDYIECLNDSPRYIRALAEVAEQHLAGWPTAQRVPAQALAHQQALAKQLGAAA